MVQTPAPSTSQRAAIRELKCPNCGGPLPQYNPDSQTLVCPRCHSYISEGEEGIKATKGIKLPQPRVPLEIGARGTLNGVNGFIMGRVLYQGWDSSDTSDNWTWNEWLVGMEDGRILWLSYDEEEGFHLFNKLRIREPFDPRLDTSIPVGNGQKAGVTESYPAKILGAEGELTWRAARGDRLHMVEGQGNGKKYSVQVTPSELEVYEGSAIDKYTVVSAFGGQEWVAKHKAEEEQKQSARGFTRLLGTLCLIFAVGAFIIAAGVSGSGTRIADQTVTVNTTTPEVSFPITFNQPGRPVRIHLTTQSGLPDNSSTDIGVAVVSPDQTETYVTFQEFWSESGYDDEGYWSENSTAGSDAFVPFQAGAHTIQVELDEPLNVTDVTVRVEVFAGHISPNWLIGYGVIAGIIGLVLMFSGGGMSMTTILIIAGVVIVLGLLSVAGVNFGEIIMAILDSA